MALSGATNPSESGPGSDGNEGVPSILQNFSITGTSPSDGLVSYRSNSLGGLTPLQRCSRCILQPHLTGQDANKPGHGSIQTRQVRHCFNKKFNNDNELKGELSIVTGV